MYTCLIADELELLWMLGPKESMQVEHVEDWYVLSAPILTT